MQSDLVAKKKARLLQVLGKLKGEAEEEPEGEDLVEDSAGNKYNLYCTQGQFSKQKEFFSFIQVPVCTVLQSSL